jgi:hypothetical protein
MSSDSEISIPTTITSIQYSIIEFISGTSITVRVLLFDQNNCPIEFKNVVLHGIYYKGWGHNDAYLLNYVASTLGLIITETPSTTSSAVAVIEAPVLYTNLCLDSNNDIIYPECCYTNQFNRVLDKTGEPVQHAILRFDSEGMPDVTSQLLIGPNDKPIFNEPIIRQSSGAITTELGESYVIVYNR